MPYNLLPFYEPIIFISRALCILCLLFLQPPLWWPLNHYSNYYAIECIYASPDFPPVINCGTPPSVSNGSPGTPTNTLINGMVTYTCDSGYEVSTGVTTATATCTITENWEPLPTCSRKLFWCVCSVFTHSAIVTVVPLPLRPIQCCRCALIGAIHYKQHSLLSGGPVPVSCCSLFSNKPGSSVYPTAGLQLHDLCVLYPLTTHTTTFY